MDWNKIFALLTSSEVLAVISSISGAIAAVSAMFAVYQTRTSLKDDRESNRPYFTIAAPGIKQLPQSPPFRIMIGMENIGRHPAQELVGKILMLEKSLSRQPTFTFDFSVANDIPTGTPTPWYNDTVVLPPNVPPQYIVLVIKYRDPILKKDFAQAFFMRWDGVNIGATHPDFVHVSMEEKMTLGKHLHKTLEQFGIN